MYESWQVIDARLAQGMRHSKTKSPGKAREKQRPTKLQLSVLNALYASKMASTWSGVHVVPEAGQLPGGAGSDSRRLVRFEQGLRGVGSRMKLRKMRFCLGRSQAAAGA